MTKNTSQAGYDSNNNLKYFDQTNFIDIGHDAPWPTKTPPPGNIEGD